MAGRRACLAIGVAQAGDLAYLGGAIAGAEEVGHWARQSGFDSVDVLTDAPGQPPVTIETVRTRLLALLPAGVETDTFILYFAGHGLRQQAEQHVWLLSDWDTSRSSIAVDSLKRRLASFGIRHLAIFSDACRSMPSTADIDEIDKVGVLGAGPVASRPPALDRFNAVQDGKEAYMIPGATPGEGRCIFSGVLLDALWGRDADAFADDDRVTSEALGLYLPQRAREIGERYRLSCEPESVVGLPRDHIVYFDKANPPEPIPPAAPWPAPPGPAPGGDGGAPSFAEIVGDKALLDKVLGPNFGADNPHLDLASGLPEIPDAAGAALESLAERRGAPIDHLSVDKQRVARWQNSLARIEVENAVVEAQRDRRHQGIVDAFHRVQLGDGPTEQLVVAGGKIEHIWAPGPIHRFQHSPEQSSFAVNQMQGREAQLVIEFADGVFAPVTVMKRMRTIVTRDEEGITGVLMMPYYVAGLVMAEKSLDAIAQLSAGTVSATAVDGLAAELRMEKHANPVLGIIAAYLYDVVGDVDSIRRMASFYVDHDQAIPFDIAFLGDMKVEATEAGLRAHVPAVGKRAHPDPGSKRPWWVTAATKARVGEVAGCCPWLRQGWDYLDTVQDYDQPLIRALPLARRALLPSSFTSLTEEGARKLIEAWDLKGWP